VGCAGREALGFLQDAESYLLGTRVTLIGLIFPIAVGLVTLIVQRQQTSNTSAHVQIYYRQSFAYGVGGQRHCIRHCPRRSTFLTGPVSHSSRRMPAGTHSKMKRSLPLRAARAAPAQKRHAQDRRQLRSDGGLAFGSPSARATRPRHPRAASAFWRES
jgi:hypothetical protein